jgi:hypothetical protein
MSSHRELIQFGLAASALAASPLAVAGVMFYVRNSVATMLFPRKTAIANNDFDTLGAYLSQGKP